MPQIDLLNGIPDILAETAKLEDIQKAVEDIEQWEEIHGLVLDYIYRFRLLRLLRARDTRDGLENEMLRLMDHLDRVTRPELMEILNGLGKHYASRWLAYMDLLEARLTSLQSPIPKGLLGRAHVADILRFVADREPYAVPFSELRLAMKVNKPNLTRILDLMEANELIEREAAGREKLVRLGVNGLRIITGDAPTREEEAEKKQKAASGTAGGIDHQIQLRLLRSYLVPRER